MREYLVVRVVGVMDILVVVVEVVVDKVERIEVDILVAVVEAVVVRWRVPRIARNIAWCSMRKMY